MLIAKSTYVWLDQLSRALRPRRSGRSTRSPTRSSTALAALGRHRPLADRPVGALAGVASGSSGCAATPTRSPRPTRSTTTGSPTTSAARRPTRTCATGPGRAGIRLASDMVPNHMGIDSRWVIEHPDWFLSLPEPPYPGLPFNGAEPVADDPRVGIVLEDHYWDDSDAAVVFKRLRPRDRRRALRLPRQRRHELPVERHGPARLPRGRASARRSSRRSSTSPGASRSSASTPRWSSPRSTSSGCGGPEPGAGGGDPVARRARHAEGRVRRRDARRVLARGRRPGRRRGARTRSCWPRRSGCSRATSSGRSGMHRVYNSAFMHMLRDEDERGLPAGHQGHPRVRPGDPQALRQLHEQPGREDRGRAVRQGRQVLRRRDAAGDAARAADVRPRPGRGLRREVRDGVPPGDAATSSPTRGWSSATSARSSRSSTAAAWFAEAHDFRLYDLVTDDGTRRRGRLRLLERVAAATRSLVVYHNRFADDDRAGSATRRAYARQGGRRVASGSVRRTLADGLGLAERPRRSFVVFRDAGPGSSTSGRAARSGSAACASTLDAYGTPRLLGVPRGPRRRRRPVGAARGAARRPRRRRRSRTRCASSSSSRSTMRCGP